MSAASGMEMSQDRNVRNLEGAADDSLRVVKTSSNPMLVVLAQFSSVTSGTSLGSAKVISTHCAPSSSARPFSSGGRGGTYVIQRRSVLGGLDHLDGRVLSDLGRVIHRQWHLREAEAPVV